MAFSSMPTDISQKDKVVGGVLDWGQLGWLSIGVFLFGIFVLFTYSSLGIVLSLVLGIVFLPIGVPFAFKKKGDLTLFKYLCLKHKYKYKIKKYVNKGTSNFEFDVYKGKEKQQWQ